MHTTYIKAYKFASPLQIQLNKQPSGRGKGNTQMVMSLPPLGAARGTITCTHNQPRLNSSWWYKKGVYQRKKRMKGALREHLILRQQK
jgi:hypothetical protein